MYEVPPKLMRHIKAIKWVATARLAIYFLYAAFSLLQPMSSTSWVARGHVLYLLEYGFIIGALAALPQKPYFADGTKRDSVVFTSANSGAWTSLIFATIVDIGILLFRIMYVSLSGSTSSDPLWLHLLHLIATIAFVAVDVIRIIQNSRLFSVGRKFQDFLNDLVRKSEQQVEIIRSSMPPTRRIEQWETIQQQIDNQKDRLDRGEIKNKDD